MSDTESLKQNVEATLVKADQVLAALEQTLKQAGFQAGIDGYRTMADILLGQKLWSASLQDTRLEARFGAVAKRAAALAAIFAPYTETMLKLQALAGIQLTEPLTPDEPKGPDAAVLTALRNGGQAMSITALAEATGLALSQLRPLLSSLAQSGSIRSRTAGGRTLYSLERAA